MERFPSPQHENQDELLRVIQANPVSDFEQPHTPSELVTGCSLLSLENINNKTDSTAEATAAPATCYTPSLHVNSSFCNPLTNSTTTPSLQNDRVNTRSQLRKLAIANSSSKSIPKSGQTKSETNSPIESHDRHSKRSLFYLSTPFSEAGSYPCDSPSPSTKSRSSGNSENGDTLIAESPLCKPLHVSFDNFSFETLKDSSTSFGNQNGDDVEILAKADRKSLVESSGRKKSDEKRRLSAPMQRRTKSRLDVMQSSEHSTLCFRV